jgi:hypothetical protein
MEIFRRATSLDEVAGESPVADADGREILLRNDVYQPSQ